MGSYSSSDSEACQDGEEEEEEEEGEEGEEEEEESFPMEEQQRITHISSKD